MKTATVDQSTHTVTIDGKTYRIGDELPPEKLRVLGAMIRPPKIGTEYWTITGNGSVWAFNLHETKGMP